MKTNQLPLSKLALLHYGLLALPLAFAGMPLYIHAPDFYATTQGLSLSTMGLILLAVRFFDAVQDPFIGYWGDKFSHYRLHLMIVSILCLGIGFVALFHPLPIIPIAVWFTCFIMQTTTAFSVLTIHLAALGSLWRSSRSEQSRINTMREALGLVGLILACVTPLLFKGYGYFSIVMVVTLIIGAVSFIRWYKAQEAALLLPQPREAKTPLLTLFRQHAGFYSIYALNVLASSIPAVLVLFFIRDFLGAEAQSGEFLMIYFMAGILGMPLWQRISRRGGAEKSWMFAMILSVLAFIWANLLHQGDFIAYGIICAASGFALGAELSLPPAILSSLIARTHSHAQTTVQFSVLTFITKAALALAAGVFLPLLEHLGFRPASDNTPQSLMMLGVFYALIPCLLRVIAAALFLRWMLENKPSGDSHENTYQRTMPYDSSRSL
jgi:GPH family glycoside/pentoside/hexuronide:cation symporter